MMEMKIETRMEEAFIYNNDCWWDFAIKMQLHVIQPQITIIFVIQNKIKVKTHDI